MIADIVGRVNCHPKLARQIRRRANTPKLSAPAIFQARRRAKEF
jgi:hypothetical protein